MDQQLLTNHVEVTQSGLGSGSVDLTHILTLIRPLHVSNQITADKNLSNSLSFCLPQPDMQIPDAVAIMTDPYPGVPGDHVVLHGEDGAPVVVDPGDLVTAQPDHTAGEDHVSPLRHRHVLNRRQSKSAQPSPPFTLTPPMKSGPRPPGSTWFPEVTVLSKSLEQQRSNVSNVNSWEVLNWFPSCSASFVRVGV